MSCGQNLENLRLSGMNLDLLMSLSVLGKRLFGRERQRRTSGAKAPGIFGAVAARLEVVPFSAPKDAFREGRGVQPERGIPLGM